jgi:hypothetical protein
MSWPPAVVAFALTLGSLSVAPDAHGQDLLPASAPAAAAPSIDAASLDRIASALARAPQIDTTIAPRFYSFTVATPPAPRDFMKGWNLSLAPIDAPDEFRGFGGGVGGIDVLSLIRSAVRSYRGHQARMIRERIDRELRALNKPPA